MGRLEGQIAIVTGAGSGIGYSIAETFVAEGAKVLASDVSDDVERIAEQLGDAVHVTKTDVSDEEQVASMVEACVNRFGGLSTLVNNAGVSYPIARLHELSTERFRKTLDIDLMGPYLGMKYAIPHLIDRGGGCIISMASISAFPPFTAAADYTSAKAAVKRLTESAAYEYAQDGIRVNAIAPGHIETPIYEEFADHKVQMAAKVPMGRFGEPAEIAKIAVVLATDDTSYITGQTITVDGGRLLY